jgi:hypothetical protein
MNETFVDDQETILQTVFASPASNLKGDLVRAFIPIYIGGDLNALHLGFFWNGGHYLLKGFNISQSCLRGEGLYHAPIRICSEPATPAQLF